MTKTAFRNFTFPITSMHGALLLVAAAGLVGVPADAGVPYVLQAYDECPGNPNCCEGKAPRDCGGGNQENFSTFVGHPLGGSSTYTAAALPGGGLTKRLHWVPAKGLIRVGERAIAMSDPLTGVNVFEAEFTVAEIPDAIVDAVLNLNKEKLEVLTVRGGIYRVDPVSRQVTELVAPGWTSEAVLVSVLADAMGPDGWMVDALDASAGGYRLHVVVPSGATAAGAPRTEPAMTLSSLRDVAEPQGAGAAVFSDGRIVYFDSDGEAWTTGFSVTDPGSPAAFALGEDGSLRTLYMTATSELFELDIRTGAIIPVGVLHAKGELVSLYGPWLATPKLLMATAGPHVGQPARITFRATDGSKLPNLSDLTPLGGIATGELRAALGEFGLVSGMPGDLELAVSMYDPNATSDVARKVEVYSLMVRMPTAEPKKLTEFRPHPASNGGVTLGKLQMSEGTDVLLTGPGARLSNGPHVQGWTGDTTDPLRPTVRRRINFFAYNTLNYGVEVTGGDLDGDGSDEIVTGAGCGHVFGAHVRGFRVEPGTYRVSSMAGVNFFAFGSRGGVRVASGADFDGDRKDDIVCGAGGMPSNGAQVRVFGLGSNGRIESKGLNILLGTACSGAKVGLADVIGDEKADVVATLGRDISARIYIVDGGNRDMQEWSAFPDGSVNAFPYGLEGSREGDWVGATDPLGWPIEMRIYGASVTRLRVTYAIEGSCSESGTAVVNFRGGVPVFYDTVDVVGADSNGLPVQIEMSGTFGPGGVLDGSLSFSQGTCGYSQNFAYTATRR